MTSLTPAGPRPGLDRRRVVLVAVVAAVVAALVIAALLLRPTTEAAIPAAPSSASPSRDPSGLRVRPIEDEFTVTGRVPDELKTAYSLAELLADDNAYDFGWPSFDHGVVLLPSTSALSAPLAKATTAAARRKALRHYDQQVRDHFPRHPNPSDLLSKRLELTPATLRTLGDQVVVVPGKLSVVGVQSRQTQIESMATRFAAAGWTECSYDRQLGAFVIGLERLTPDLAKALVERFGSEDVIIQLMPHSENQAGTG